jgi:DNA helicase-2/ATP-dependent DNA helicase PcrA
MKDILKDLNKKQAEAVRCIDGPTMVVAGAGSGKTRVLTYRIAYLVSKGVDPFNILALTFTNKAAREMKARVVELVGGNEARDVYMGTFHSVFARILRYEAKNLGYLSNFSIYDTEDSKRLIKKIIKEQDLDDKIYNPGYVLNKISSAKTSNLISPDHYNSDSEILNYNNSIRKPKIGLLYSLYSKRCFKAGAMDFDDLLFNTYILLRDFPEALSKYQKKFKYILVDEYQDTNYIQYLIVKKLSADNKNLCVVGDDAQSIYAFRGADIKNILNFKKDYPDLNTFKLEQNYRSTKMIVNAADSIIVNNKKQIPKKIWTENNTGEKIKLIKSITDNEEGKLVAGSIFENKMNYHLENKKFAILYRTNAQSRIMEEALRKINIPYKIYGGLSFYKRKEIKDIISYFQLTVNNKNEEALIRVINYPKRGIGKNSIDRIVVFANKMNKSLWNVLEEIDKSDIDISNGVKSKIYDFVIMIKSFSAHLKTKNAYELAKEITDSTGIIKNLYEDKSPDGVNRYENIEELLNAIKEFSERKEDVNKDNSSEIKTLDEFIQDIALLTDAEDNDKNNINRVSLMTVHAAKGLEFSYVYIVGMEENLFPSVQSLSSGKELEEERRLFYVAITRAKKQVIISYSENRYRWGQILICEPSRFIEEIDSKYIDIPEEKSINKELKFGRKNNYLPHINSSIKIKDNKGFDRKFKRIRDLNNSSNVNYEADNTKVFQVGMQVEHNIFGKGKIINIDGSDSNRKATVFFKNIGQKQLVLKFAKLKIL